MGGRVQGQPFRGGSGGFRRGSGQPFRGGSGRFRRGAAAILDECSGSQNSQPARRHHTAAPSAPPGPQITAMFTRHHVLFRHAVARPDALRRLFTWLQHDLDLPPASIIRMLHRCPTVLQVRRVGGAGCAFGGQATAVYRAGGQQPSWADVAVSGSPRIDGSTHLCCRRGSVRVPTH